EPGRIPQSGTGPDGWIDYIAVGPFFAAGSLGKATGSGKIERSVPGLRRRPVSFIPPSSGSLHVDSHRGFIDNVVVLTSEPIIKPSLQKLNRLIHGRIWHGMHPRSHQEFFRARQPGIDRRNSFRKNVAPAADHECRHLDL